MDDCKSLWIKCLLNLYIILYYSEIFLRRHNLFPSWVHGKYWTWPQFYPRCCAAGRHTLKCSYVQQKALEGLLKSVYIFCLIIFPQILFSLDFYSPGFAFSNCFLVSPFFHRKTTIGFYVFTSNINLHLELTCEFRLFCCSCPLIHWACPCTAVWLALLILHSKLKGMSSQTTGQWKKSNLTFYL